MPSLVIKTVHYTLAEEGLHLNGKQFSLCDISLEMQNDDINSREVRVKSVKYGPLRRSIKMVQLFHTQ